MFSPDEQKAIKAKSLQQWQQEQRAARQERDAEIRNVLHTLAYARDWRNPRILR